MKYLRNPSRHRRRWLLPAVGMLVLLPLIAVGMIRAGSAHSANAPTVVSIEFDDGYSDQYQALSMLSAHNMHATFFINSGSPGQQNYMTWSQLHDVTSAGNEIGGHTVSHVNSVQVSTDEATRQVCNDRVNLTNQGFTVTDFAYPYGANNASVQSVVQGCGYNSARDVKGLVSPSGCSGCPYAETIPPANYYDTRTSDNITSSMSLATIEGEVTQAQQNGGGWTQLVVHHVCNGCDTYAITPANLSALLDWLQQQQSNNTTIQTVNQVIGGPLQPAITGPPPPANQPLQNPSLETDTSPADGVPDCWSTGSTGTNTTSFTRTADAHTGSYAERVDVSNYSSGDAKLVTQQDLGQCAYSITSGQSYQLSGWYKGTGQIAFVAFTRNAVGGWTFCKQSPFFEVASSTWTQAIYNWSQPATSSNCGVNIGYTPTAISFGLALSSNGSLTTDDAAIAPVATDTTAPSTTIGCNSSACGSSAYPGLATITLNATDNSGGSGVYLTYYTTDGSTPSPSNLTTSIYTGPFALTRTTKVIYRSVDYAGNFESSKAQTVNVTADTTPPTSTISCSGGPCSGWFGSAGTTVALSATDNTGGSGVKAIYYTTDGSDPTTSSPTYTSPFALTSTSTVKFRAIDKGGNLENVQSQTVQVESIAPVTSASCNGAPCGGWYVAAPVTVSLKAIAGGSGVRAIYYTTDGSEPTTASPTYTAPLTVSTSTTVKYLAADNAGNVEATNTQQVNIDTAAPASAISCGGSSCNGWFGSAGASVTLTATDNGGSGVANIYYTTDGSTPDANSTIYTGAFTVNSSATVEFRAQDVAGNLEQVNSQTVDVDSTAPTTSISCSGGSCGSWFGAAGTSVTLSATDTGGPGVAAIYYTTDGTDPSTSSPTYTAPFAVTSTSTIKLRAQDNAGNLGAVQSQTVQVDSTAPTSSISCSGGSCGSWFGAAGTSVTLSATDTGGPGVAAIYYTTDGTDPSTSSPTYTAPFAVTSTETVKFRAQDTLGVLESTNTQLIQVDATTPLTAISCNGFACNSWYTAAPVTVALNATDGGSGVRSIFYTTDGTDPSTSSPAYSSPLAINSNTMLKYRAIDNAGNLEQVEAQAIKFDSVAPTSTVICNSTTCGTGWYRTSPVTVGLAATDNQGGSTVANIYYTTDGSTPTTSSPVYAGPLSVVATTRITFRAQDVVGNLEQAKSQLIQIDTTAPTTTASCNSLSCSSWFPGSVTLKLVATDNQGGSGVTATRYTLDGSTPTVTSPLYTTPLQFASTKTIKFRSWDTAGNVEAVQTTTAQIDTVAPTIAITSPTKGAKVTGNVVIKTKAADKGGSGLASVSFYVDGTTLIGSVTSSPWQSTWNTKAVTKGSHVLTAVATDAAGNRTTSAAITVTVS